MPAPAAQTSTAPQDPVRQFSVFTENQPGRLHTLIALLKQHEVHVMAITVLDTVDSAIIRLVVDDPDKARGLMDQNDFPYSEATVMAVEFDNEADLKGVLAALLEAEINVHYTYSFLKRPAGRGALAISVEDPEVAAQAVSRRGYKVLTQGDISR
ncbi:MAG TPA: acetolactate synthase [Opitutaceae bacterium]|nr:acetolactate synthase [Opitutaceae bacterium]